MAPRHSLQERAERLLTATPADRYAIGDVLGLLQEMKDALEGVPPVNPAGTLAVALLEREVARFKIREQDLLEHNTALLLRARAAEAQLKELRELA